MVIMNRASSLFFLGLLRRLVLVDLEDVANDAAAEALLVLVQNGQAAVLAFQLPGQLRLAAADDRREEMVEGSEIIHRHEGEPEARQSVEVDTGWQSFDVLDLVLDASTKGSEKGRPTMDAIVICRHDDEGRKLERRIHEDAVILEKFRPHEHIDAEG